MKFDIKVVRNYLLKKDEVFTVRTWESRNRFGVVNFEGRSYMTKMIKAVSDPKDLKGFVRRSGFSKMVDWWDAVKGFGAENGFLYHITLLEDEIPEKTYIPEFTAVLEAELRDCDIYARSQQAMEA